VNLGDTYSGSGQGSQVSGGDYKRQKVSATMEKAITLDCNIPTKSLCLIPERFALAMVESGWILRNKICWHKPNPMPSSVKDRFTNTWEYLFFFVKAKKYFFDLDAVREPHKTSANGYTPYDIAKGKSWGKHSEDDIKGNTSKNIRAQHPSGKNPGDMFKGPIPGQTADQFKRKGHSGYYDKKGNLMVNPAGKNPGDFFEITTQPFPEAHFATFPEALLVKPIKAGCPQWICKKCGKIRERVIESPKRGANKERDYLRTGKDDLRPPPKNAKYEGKTLGFTDCGCNAGWESGVIVDPFMGSGTTAKMARKYSRNYLGFELNPEYIKIAEKQLAQGVLF